MCKPRPFPGALRWVGLGTDLGDTYIASQVILMRRQRDSPWCGELGDRRTQRHMMYKSEKDLLKAKTGWKVRKETFTWGREVALKQTSVKFDEFLQIEHTLVTLLRWINWILLITWCLQVTLCRSIYPMGSCCSYFISIDSFLMLFKCYGNIVWHICSSPLMCME
jgi:hypothetical protein